MGVQGLWELLAPVGRRVSVETLAGKKLAIDASIWMIQFMKAMRDEKGEMVRNAHVLGFFRRICKLLFLRTKPVFVFDGGTPALKRQTIAVRRRHRENARAKIRKTAEKLLLNHLKGKKLEELAEEIKNSRRKNDSKGKQVKDDSKGKQVMMSNDDTGFVGHSFGEDRIKSADAYNQESLDELLAASLAAEEEKRFINNEPASAGNVSYEEEDDGDEDEEMIFPVTSGNIDPTVLASLPPSMQLDLLVQMRERLMAENRQKYQKIKKVPTKFSELQIQSYLKTVAFRREIVEAQKCAAGSGLGGVQTSRIASEANREFIFSSSFTGDKQMLTAVQKNGDNDHHALKNKPVISDLLKHNSSTSPYKPTTDVCIGELAKNFGDDVETYCDERGRVRVSRVRGLGMRMTRDLQRNLDLMKEYEEGTEGGDVSTDPEPSASISKDVINETLSKNSGMLKQKDRSDAFDGQSMLGGEAAIEISFLEDDDGMKDTDNLFLHLVSGSSSSKLFSQNVNSEKNTDDSESEFIWEEGVVEERKDSREGDQKEIHTSLLGVSSCEEDEVGWEEGAPQLPNVSSHCQSEHDKAVLGEEAEIQEAIRRSLEDFKGEKSPTIPPSNANLGISSVDHNSVGSLFYNSTLASSLEMNPSCAATDGLDSCREDVVQTVYSLEKYLSSSTVSGVDLDVESTFKDGASGKLLVSSVMDNEIVVTSLTNNVPGKGPSESHFIQKDAGDEPSIRISTEDFTEIDSIMNSKTTGDAHCNDSEVSESSRSFGRRYNSDISQKSSLMEETVVHQETEQSIEKEDGLHTVEVECFEGKNITQHYLDDHMKVAESNLDEEISLLRQERVVLGDEQRKLERNAESVSSEMFAECQELLQMFGLPYIIAPMEAEAQCAHMEMANLVDGVVTDDSDVFLFGARNVYKNIFDDRKYVETYLMKDIESELGLSREQLIRMALLLGSDYTEGVSGIGIVNAIEVVHAFPEENGLQKFREWIESADPAILGKLDSNTGSKLKKTSECSASGGIDGQPSVDCTPDTKEIFMNKHRNVSKNWYIPSSFPSKSVVSAYISPQVDESTDPFSWGKPDQVLLRKLCWERFGWNIQKADELLVPVLKEYNKHETQLRLEAFYTFNERFAKIRSQRIKKAVKGIMETCSSELMCDQVHEDSKSGIKRKWSPSAPEECKPDINSDGKTNSGRKTPKPSRRHAKTGLSKNVRGREKGRGRGRGRRRGRGEEQNPESTEASSSDDSGGTGETVKHDKVPEATRELRRSIRQRKRVTYSEENLEFDDLGHSSYQNDREILHESAVEQERVDKDCKAASFGDSSGLNKGVNPNPEDSLSVDYIFSRGGFCIDKGDTQADEVRVGGDACGLDEGGIPREDSFSGDYLFKDGGFCVDENYREGCALQPASSPLKDSMERVDAFQIAQGLEVGRSTAQDNPKPVLEFENSPVGENACSQLEQEVKGRADNSCFSAMPSLKRKRKVRR